MSGKDFSEVVDEIVREDPRYDRAAYVFIRKALDHTVKTLPKVRRDGSTRHVTGPELLEGVRVFALEQFGPMTLTVLNHWGINRCRDFGDLVFNLVAYGVFGKTEQDRPEDFDHAYSFEEAFQAPFRPRLTPSSGLETADPGTEA